MPEIKKYDMPRIKTWMTEHHKPGLIHIEYVIGTKGQVLEYSERQVQAYGGTITSPVPMNIPERLQWNEKVVNLTQ